METSILSYYNKAAEALIARCTGCAKCVTSCRAFGDFGGNPKRIAKNTLAFLKGEEPLCEESEARLRGCMRCFGCVKDWKCSAGVDPMTLEELVWRKIERSKEKPFDIDPYPIHEARARAFTTQEEYERITNERVRGGARVLFFPGCNVYKQPDKLLLALMILDEIGIPYSFLPGIEYCCGLSARGVYGEAEWLETSARRLFGKAESLGIETMIFWCPTCLCNLETRVKRILQPSFECISFAQFVERNLEKLSFPAAKPCRVTYHEPCKTAYLGLDTDAVRSLLLAVPGTELSEMAHHGENTLCCGCEAVPRSPETGEKMTRRRIDEAKATGAEIMIDVCHNCHWIFEPRMGGSGLRAESYVSYLARAMGKPREDSLSSALSGLKNTGKERVK